MMMQAEQDLTAVIWGRKTAVCAGIEECLKRNGWRTVYASAEDGGELVWDLEYDCPDCPLDLLIFGDDSDLFTHTGPIYENQERAAVLGAFDFHVNGALYALHTLLPRLERGKLKRICYVTTKESSNNMCYDNESYGEHMIRVARNMQARIMMNRLRPEGYTFRVFCCCTPWKQQESGKRAAAYFLKDRSRDESNLLHSDEDRLVMRDEAGREIPW